MFTAETQSGFLKYNNTSTKRRFMMKRTSSIAADALRGPERRQQQQKGVNMAISTPRASGASKNISKNGGGSMHRCSQSASVSSKSLRRSCSRSFMASMGSHSAQVEPVPTRSEELPIPPRDREYNNGGMSSLSRSADVHDLAKMYDHATWNMYERIVSARRRRITEMDAQEVQRSQSQSTGEKSAPAKNQQQQPLHKNPSQDGESSTIATADETDRGSTTSSSWSRNNSPGTIPSMHFASANYAFSGLEQARAMAVHSCPPPAMEGDSEDDHFIFQLDM